MCLRGTAQDTGAHDKTIKDILSRMTLEEKVSLCSGSGVIDFKGVPRLGIPAVRLTDGPRGPHGDSSTGFPCGVGLASSWNPSLMEEAGRVMGEETRAFGCSVLLGPACNILRDPVGGRFFEYYTEDPFLNSRITVPVVKGIQSADVAACLKHYACNNRESNRNFYFSVVDDRTLHEIYLPAYKAAVEEAGLWSIMTSANGVNYEYVSDSRKLLTDILKDRWGFDGVVITDWLQTRSTEKAAFAGLDISMPGGDNCGFAQPLLEAVRKGRVPESVIDEKVTRILRLYARVGALDGNADVVRGFRKDTPEHREVARRVAEEGMVLLKNEGGVLPLDPGKVRNILVTGPNATLHTCAWAMGGSSWMLSPDETTVLEGIKDVYGARKVTFLDFDDLGGFQEISPELLAKDGNGNPTSFNARYFIKGKEAPALTRAEKGINFMWEMRSPDEEKVPVDEWTEARFDFTVIPPADGKYTFRFTAGGGDVFALNGEWGGAPVAVVHAANAGHGTATGSVDLKKGIPYQLCVIYTKGKGDASLHIDWSTPQTEKAVLKWKELDKAARKADAVIFVGGLDMNLDTEGRDRSSLLFPALQQEVINYLAKRNKRTIVTLVNGSPLELDGWIDNVPAVLESWYGGIDGGTAVAGILSGRVNPSGRLTFTWPRKYEDTPIRRLASEDNDIINFTDSLMVGYRYYDTKGVEPMFPFGYGLSYTTFAYGDLAVTADGCRVKGSLTVSNTGKKDGKETVQVYVRPLTPSVFRPAHELKAFEKVEVPAGGRKEVSFELGPDAFSYYDVGSGDWRVDPGEYLIEVGYDSRHILLSEKVTIRPAAGQTSITE